MLSRAANSVYWMSRYLERADNVARFAAVNAHLALDLGLDREQAQWAPLVYASGDDQDFSRRYQGFDETNVLRFLTFDTANPNSILSCVQYARENARTLREVISSEMWEALNALYHMVEKHGRKRRIDDLQEFFLDVRSANHFFNGLVHSTMSHGEAWQFLQLGQMLERADKTARILDVKYFALLPAPDMVDSPQDAVEWGAVLKSVSGFEMYLKQFHRANYRDVTGFLIFDEEFPRAIRHCVQSGRAALARIVDLLRVDVIAISEMEKLLTMLDHSSIDQVLDGGLHEFIDVFQFNLNVVDDALHRSFFDLEPA